MREGGTGSQITEGYSTTVTEPAHLWIIYFSLIFFIAVATGGEVIGCKFHTQQASASDDAGSREVVDSGMVERINQGF